MYENYSEPMLTRGEFALRFIGHLGFSAGLVGISLLVGMLGYHSLARMGWTDSFLNAAMLLGGMGPVGTLVNRTAKIFAGIYALYAGLVFIACSGILIAPIAHRVLHKLHLDVDE